MNSEAMDRDPMDDDHGQNAKRNEFYKDATGANPRSKHSKDSGPLGWASVDMLKLFARYKAGDFNEKAAREVADVFRELSDAAVTIKTGDSDEPSDDSISKDGFLNVREDFSDLKDDFYGLKDDYFDLKDDYISLKESYLNIKIEYTALKTEYAKLKDLYVNDLEDEKNRISTKVKSIQRKVRMYFLLLLLVALLGTPPAMDFIYKLLGLQ